MRKSTKPTAKPAGRRASDESAETIPKENDPGGWSEYMFGSYNPDEDRIALHRVSPIEHQGVPTAGWLDDVTPPGIDENYIREHYGGGKFHLIKRNRDTGKITASCTFDLPGFPKVVPASASLKDEEENMGAAAPSVMLNVAGTEVPFSGDLKTLADFVLAMKAIKSVFPDPVDINADLLQLALKKDTAPDPLETIRSLKEAVDLFSGQGSTGSNVYDLVQTAIQQAGPVIQAMVAAPVPHRRPVLPRPGPGNGSGKQPVPITAKPADEPIQVTDIRPGAEPSEETETTTKEGGPMSQRELILAVASTIMACWKLDPPKTAMETVRMVDLILQESDAAVRKILVDSRGETIYDICETGLAEEWMLEDSHVGDRKAFGKFFIDVMKEYTRIDREVLVL